MKDFYKNTRECMDKYNQILDVICEYDRETTDEEDEFLQNFSIYFAHGLIKDYPGSKDELLTVAKIIEAFCG